MAKGSDNSDDILDTALESGKNAAVSAAKKTVITKAKEIIFGRDETPEEMAAKGKGSAIVQTLYSIKDADLQLHPDDPHIMKIANIYKTITQRFYKICPGLNLFYVDETSHRIFWKKPIVRTRARPLSTFNETLHSAIDAITHDYFLQQQLKDPCLSNGEGIIRDPKTLISLLLPRAVDAIERSDCENKNKLFDALSTFCSSAVPVLTEKSDSEKSYFVTRQSDIYNEAYTKNTHRLIKGYTKESVRQTVIPDMTKYLTPFFNQHAVLTVKLEDILRRFLPINRHRENIETATLSIKPTIFLNKAVRKNANSQIEDIVPFNIDSTKVNIVSKNFSKIYESANDTTEIAKNFIRYFSIYTDNMGTLSATNRAKKLATSIRVIIRIVKRQSRLISRLQEQLEQCKSAKNKSNIFKLYNYSEVIKFIKATPEFKKLKNSGKRKYIRYIVQNALPNIEHTIVTTFLAYQQALLADCAIKALYYFAMDSNNAAATLQVQTLITYLSNFYLNLGSVCDEVNLVAKDEFFYYSGLNDLSQTISHDVTYLRKAISRADEQRSHINDCIEPLKANIVIRNCKPKCRSQGQKLLDTALNILLDTIPHQKDFNAENLDSILLKIRYTHAYEFRLEQGCNPTDIHNQDNDHMLTSTIENLDIATQDRTRNNGFMYRQRSSTHIIDLVLWSSEFITNIQNRLTEAHSDYEIYSIDHRWSWSSKHSDELIEKNRKLVDSISDISQQLQDDYSNKTYNSIEAQKKLIEIYDSIYDIIKDKSTGEKHSIGHYLKKQFYQESSFHKYYDIREDHAKKNKNKIPLDEPEYIGIFDNLDEYVSCDESTTDNLTSTDSVPTDQDSIQGDEAPEVKNHPRRRSSVTSNARSKQKKNKPKQKKIGIRGCCSSPKVLEPTESELDEDYRSDIDDDSADDIHNDDAIESKTTSTWSNQHATFQSPQNRRKSLSRKKGTQDRYSKSNNKRRSKSTMNMTQERTWGNRELKRKTKSVSNISSQLTDRKISRSR